MRIFLYFIMAFLFIGCHNEELEAQKQKTQQELFEHLDDEAIQESSQKENELYFAATKEKRYYKKIAPKYVSGWVNVKVRANDGTIHRYIVMASPVTKDLYNGNGGKEPVTAVPYTIMNEFCIKEMKGLLITPYVFDAARKTYKLQKPTGGITHEIIAPLDEEDDEDFFSQEDHMISKEGTMIEFDWEKERYVEVPNIYTSPEATFRCMRLR